MACKRMNMYILFTDYINISLGSCFFLFFSGEYTNNNFYSEIITCRDKLCTVTIYGWMPASELFLYPPTSSCLPPPLSLSLCTLSCSHRCTYKCVKNSNRFTAFGDFFASRRTIPPVAIDHVVSSPSPPPPVSPRKTKKKSMGLSFLLRRPSAIGQERERERQRTNAEGWPRTM